jgi:hypothetical protein
MSSWFVDNFKSLPEEVPAAVKAEAQAGGSRRRKRRGGRKTKRRGGSRRRKYSRKHH